MDIKQFILPLSIVFLAVALIVTIYVVYETKKQRKKASAIVKTKKSTNQSLNVIYLKSYNSLIKLKLFKSPLLKIRKKVETIAVYDDMEIRRQTMKIFFRFAAIIIGVLLLLMLIRPGLLFSFWILVGIMFFIGLMTDQFIYKTEMKLLNQLKYYNGRIRHYYQQTHMVDEAAYEAIADVGPEMKVQATKIHNILMSVNPDEEQAKYEEIAPTRFLKVISGLMVLVKDKGDIIDKEKGSAFTRGISAVTKELNLEIMYRSKLAHRMRFLAGMALTPIFLSLPIQNHTTKMFPVIQKFYESRTGLIAAVLIYTSAVGVYLLIRKLKAVGETKYKVINQNRWEKWSLEKIPYLEKLMLAIGPKHNTKKYAKRYQLLKDANSAPKVTWLTLRQTVLALITVIVLVAVLLFGHSREEHAILYSVLPDSIISGNLTPDEYDEYVKQTEFDRNFVFDLQSRDGFTMKEIQEELKVYFGVDEVTDRKVTTAYDRIMKKYIAIENAFLKWWEFLIILIVAVVVWQTPLVVLNLQKSMRLKDMENEVHQFLTIISILREFNTITSYSLLVWLERFAVTFKAPLQVAIQNYDSGPEEALKRLAEDNNFDAFKQIIERMQLALVRLNVKEAFEDIDIEREFYLEQRVEFNERSISNKASISSMLSFLPAGLLILLYFVGPILYMSITEMSNLMKNL